MIKQLFIVCLASLLSISGMAATKSAKHTKINKSNALETFQILSNHVLRAQGKRQLQQQQESDSARELVAFIQSGKPSKLSAVTTKKSRHAPKVNTNASNILQWVKAEDSHPKQGFIAAYLGNQPEHVCATPYHGGIHPGRMVATGCLVSYAGKTKIITKNFLLLEGNPSVKWQNSTGAYPMPIGPLFLTHGQALDGNTHSHGKMPVIAGFEDNKPIYICRTIYNNRLYVGKFDKYYCHIAVNKKEYDTRFYQILTY